MKFAISETYLYLKKIEEYQTQNHTGFRKICKKHDKILVRDTGKKFMTDTIAEAAFWTDKGLLVFDFILPRLENTGIWYHQPTWLSPPTIQSMFWRFIKTVRNNDFLLFS